MLLAVSHCAFAALYLVLLEPAITHAYKDEADRSKGSCRAYMEKCQPKSHPCCPGLHCVYQRCRWSGYPEDLREFTLLSMHNHRRTLDKILREPGLAGTFPTSDVAQRPYPDDNGDGDEGGGGDNLHSAPGPTVGGFPVRHYGLPSDGGDDDFDRRAGPIRRYGDDYIALLAGSVNGRRSGDFTSVRFPGETRTGAERASSPFFRSPGVGGGGLSSNDYPPTFEQQNKEIARGPGEWWPPLSLRPMHVEDEFKSSPFWPKTPSLATRLPYGSNGRGPTDSSKPALRGPTGGGIKDQVDGNSLYIPLSAW